MTDRAPVNSHDIAEAHGDVYAYAGHFNGGYDTPTVIKDGKKAAGHWFLQARKGKTWKRPKGEQVPLEEMRGRKGKLKPFATFDDLAAFCAEKYGITGWKRDKHGGYHPDNNASDWPCGRRTHGSGFAGHSSCDKKRKPGEKLCGLHLNADRKAKERNDAYQKDREESDAGSKIAQDAIDRLAALEMGNGRPIEADQHYSWRTSKYTGDVVIHAEDVMTLLDEIDEYRKMMSL